MKICITSPPLDTFGGAERVIINDANHFLDQGHDVHIITDEIDGNILSEFNIQDNINIHTCGVTKTKGIDLVSRAFSFRGHLNRISPDAILAHYVEKETWMALQTLNIDPIFTTHVHGSLLWFQDAGRRLPHVEKKCVQDIVSAVPGHSQFWNLENQSAVYRAGMTLIEKLNKITLQSCDVVFTNTNQLKQELKCLYDIDSVVTPPGISHSWDKKTHKNVRLPTGQPYILSISRLDPRKRIDLLIRAFAGLQEPDIHLIIGGTGGEEDKLKRLSKELDVRDVVHFPGYIDEEDLPGYYKNAEVHACPAWMSYGLTPLESVSVKTKTAISTDTFVKEIIGGHEGVNVIPPVIDEWTKNLHKLFTSDSEPSPDIVPTVKEHGDNKLTMIKKALRASR